MNVALALRYRSQLERSRNNALHELQRLQAARRGLVVAAAEVVDVNVSFERQNMFSLETLLCEELKLNTVSRDGEVTEQQIATNGKNANAIPVYPVVRAKRAQR